MLDVYLGSHHGAPALQLQERDFAGRWALIEALRQGGVAFDFYLDFHIQPAHAATLTRVLDTHLATPLNQESPAVLALYALLLRAALEGHTLYFVGD